MGRTKFVVVKARELVKTAVFAVLGIIILAGLITFFLHMGEDDTTGMYRDGTYYGQMAAGGTVTELVVVIEEGRIADISVETPAEAVTVFYPLLEPTVAEVGQAVVEQQSLEVAVAQEKEHSARLVLDAVAQCLKEAER